MQPQSHPVLAPAPGQHASIALLSAQASRLIVQRIEENESQTVPHEVPPVCVPVEGVLAQMSVCKIFTMAVLTSSALSLLMSTVVLSLTPVASAWYSANTVASKVMLLAGGVRYAYRVMPLALAFAMAVAPAVLAVCGFVGPPPSGH